MSALFLLSGAVRRDGAVEAWFDVPNHEIRRIVRPWFEAIRALGEDVTELIHDGWPTACVEGAAFAYVAAFAAHASVGFYHGAELPDPAGLLQGTGKRMRHVKLPWGEKVDEAALAELITAAYRDIRARLRTPLPEGEGLGC